MAAFARLFREDAIWVGLSGRVWIGRPAIEAEHVESHRTFLRNSRQTVRVDEIRLIAPGVAIARLSTVVTGDETAKGGISRARKLFMLTRAADGIWEITAGQNTRLADNVSD